MVKYCIIVLVGVYRHFVVREKSWHMLVSFFFTGLSLRTALPEVYDIRVACRSDRNKWLINRCLLNRHRSV